MELGPAFGALDWGVLIVYFVVVLTLGNVTAWIGSRFGRRRLDTRDYFKASGMMPVWAVALSVLSTAQSAATFIGGPEQSYRGNLTYLSSNIGMVLAAVIIARWLIPVYYARNVTTPYELLESRFGGSARVATSCVYLIGRVFASGARVFIGALPMSLVVFGDTEAGHMVISIAIVSFIGTVYALAGGIRSVIWTDVLQVSVYMGSAIVAIGLLLWRIDAPLSSMLDALAQTPAPGGTNKLTLLNTGLSPGGPGTLPRYNFGLEYTLLTSLTGFVLLGLAAFGLDQDLVQRMLTCRSAKKGAWSVISGTLAGIPAVCVFMFLGLLLFVYYEMPELSGETHEPGQRQKFLQFILEGVPSGIAGLMMAGLFAAGMAPLTSMSSAFVNDLYRPARPGRSDRHYLLIGRLGVAAFGVVLGLFAAGCIYWYNAQKQTLIDFALSVMAFAYAGLLGVFFTAVLTRRGNAASAIASLVVGFVAVALMEPAIWKWWTAAAGLRSWERAIIAFPWRLTIGAAVAFLVAAAPPGRSTAASRGREAVDPPHPDRARVTPPPPSADPHAP